MWVIGYVDRVGGRVVSMLWCGIVLRESAETSVIEKEQ